MVLIPHHIELDAVERALGLHGLSGRSAITYDGSSVGAILVIRNPLQTLLSYIVTEEVLESTHKRST